MCCPLTRVESGERMYSMWLNYFIYFYWLAQLLCIREAPNSSLDPDWSYLTSLSISKKLGGWYGTFLHALPSLSLTIIVHSMRYTLLATEKHLNNEINYAMRSEVFRATTDHIVVFWVMWPCSRVRGYQCFRGKHCPHLQGWYQPIRLYGAIIQKTTIRICTHVMFLTRVTQLYWTSWLNFASRNFHYAVREWEIRE
jgi:hypothetical protein